MLKKILIISLIVGAISLVGIASVKAYAHHNYDYNYCHNCGYDNNETANNVIKHNCSNYIDENNDGICDNCINQSNTVNYQHNHHRHGHH